MMEARTTEAVAHRMLKFDEANALVGLGEALQRAKR
jgi:hypothetical protein